MARTNRRAFLKHSLAALAGSAAFDSVFGKIALAATTAPSPRHLEGTGYRALVCIYLYGGNDCFNMVVPRDGYWSTYNATRGSLAIPQADLLELTPAVPPTGGGSYGLHPNLAGIKELFDNGRAAMVANVGPLVRPVNQALYQQPGTLLPAQLFSHSDQSVLWQTPRADASERYGWGGRLADIFAATNPNQVLSMNVSLDGDNVFQAGVSVSPYFMSASGVEEIDMIQTGGANCAGPNGWNRRRCESFNALLNASYSHPFERAYAEKTRSTIAVSAQVAAALALHPQNDVVFRPFWDAFGLNWDPGNLPALPALGAQLLMVARMIKARVDLDMMRQLFFVARGGFDTHDNQMPDHAELMDELSRAVKGFYDVMGSPAFNLANQVTAFTASEFGRTLTNNGDGTDHGWGGHHLVFGGAVNGNRIYGRMPSLAATNNPDDAGWGQIIPTLSVDQYAATLASWYGLSPVDRDVIFPNLQHMTGPLLAIEGPDLGFMQPA